MTNRTRIDDGGVELAAARARLAGTRGPQFWRSLEELAQTEEFLQYLHREFPENAAEWSDPVGRRQFLRLMAASLALAGVSGCVVQPEEQIVPYVRSPEEIVPGEPLFFATAVPLGGFATGVLVESHMGRPTKIEGNLKHPASLGATDAFAQAAVLTLYDPERSQVTTRNGRVSTWDDFLKVLIETREAKKASKGAGLLILTETVTSPTLARQLKAVLEQFPEARWHIHDPVGQNSARAGASLAFGEPVATVHHLDKAEVILALDADIFHWGPSRLRDARGFADRREPADPKADINRLYVVEACPTITGAMADHRLALSSHRIADAALSIAKAIGIENPPAGGEPLELEYHGWIATVAADLKAKPGASLVLAGETQPPEVHALVHAMNQALGNVGKTVVYIDPVEATPPEGRGGDLASLVADLNQDQVDTLLILGGNPVYDAPADLDFASALKKAKFRVHLGLYNDETGQICHWHIPEAHFLESWSDLRAFDGSVTIQQPLIAPLSDGKSAHQLLSALLGETDRPTLDLVRETWKNAKDQSPEAFETFWRDALLEGVVAGTAFPPKEVSLKSLADLKWPTVEKVAGDYEIVFRPDPTVWDGRFANNAWLQELPKPLTKLTWDNAALISPAMAKRLGIQNEDVIELTSKGRKLQAAAWIVPGHAEESVTISLGYGRTESGQTSRAAGFNAYLLRTSDAPWSSLGLTVRKTGARYRLATTQHHYNMEGRELVRAATLDEYRAEPAFAQKHDEAHGHGHSLRELTLFENPEPQRLRQEEGVGNAWGMAINLNTCIGCNACVIACQAENNIPVVGKNEVLRGREMHWIRIDRYYATVDAKAPEKNPKTYFQPVPCMHCENAPCELVCPVEATTHSAEGLNEMTYNRCVGTRYCSNNCPYKVRRFNWFDYHHIKAPSLKLLQNPDVTVRFRGVMEKCTYCVQRINNARIASEMKGEPRVGGNAVVTACQGACPTRAIVFGNLNDPEGEAAKAKRSPRNYALLAELNTRPRTTYLAKLTNPNQAIKAE